MADEYVNNSMSGADYDSLEMGGYGDIQWYATNPPPEPVVFHCGGSDVEWPVDEVYSTNPPPEPMVFHCGGSDVEWPVDEVYSTNPPPQSSAFENGAADDVEWPVDETYTNPPPQSALFESGTGDDVEWPVDEEYYPPPQYVEGEEETGEWYYEHENYDADDNYEEEEEEEGEEEKVEESGGDQPKKVCRICHDDGNQSDIETPCACDGTIKFAHRACVQKWCDMKGGIECEICHEVFEPNYTFPPRSDAEVAIAIRDSENDRHERHLIVAALQQQMVQQGYALYRVEMDRSYGFFRSIGCIVMAFLFLRETLMFLQDTGLLQDGSGFFSAFGLFVSILVPLYLIAHVCYVTFCNGRF